MSAILFESDQEYSLHFCNIFHVSFTIHLQTKNLIIKDLESVALRKISQDCKTFMFSPLSHNFYWPQSLLFQERNSVEEHTLQKFKSFI